MITDLFSRWVEAFPIASSKTSVLIATLEREIFPRWGYPRQILSDNGKQCTSQKWIDACQKWDCDLWTTPLYHPRANPTESRNQELKKGIRLRIDQGNHNRWETYHPEILLNLHRRRNAATGQTPSHLLLGQTIQRPGEWRFDDNEPQERTDLNTRDEQARQHQEKYQQRYAGANRAHAYQPGDQVYALTHPLSNAEKKLNKVSTYRRSGVHTIVSKIAGDVYWILCDGRQLKIHGETPEKPNTVMTHDQVSEGTTGHISSQTHPITTTAYLRLAAAPNCRLVAGTTTTTTR